MYIVGSVLPPFPTVLAVTGSGSIALSLIMAIGFLANAFQICCNCFLGATRLIVAMDGDRIFPSRFGLGVIDPVRRSPVRAHWAYFVASIPWMAAYHFVPGWPIITLGVTFAGSYVFAFSALAATRIPTTMSALWLTSDIASFSPTLIRATGFIAFGASLIAVVTYLFLPNLGLTRPITYTLVFASIVASVAMFQVARQSRRRLDVAVTKPPRESGLF